VGHRRDKTLEPKLNCIFDQNTKTTKIKKSQQKEFGNDGQGLGEGWAMA